MGARENEDFAPLPGADKIVVPQPAAAERPADDPAEARSLLEDLETLIEDGKTYLEAEVQFQKTRAAYVADGARASAVYGAVAGAFGFIALIGLTVGLIMALEPFLTVWGSSAVVVGVEAVIALILARRAARRWGRVMAALRGDEESRP